MADLSHWPHWFIIGSIRFCRYTSFCMQQESFCEMWWILQWQLLTYGQSLFFYLLSNSMHSKTNTKTIRLGLYSSGGGFPFKDTVAVQIGNIKFTILFVTHQWHSTLGGYNSYKRHNKLARYDWSFLVVFWKWKSIAGHKH